MKYEIFCFHFYEYNMARRRRWKKIAGGSRSRNIGASQGGYSVNQPSVTAVSLLLPLGARGKSYSNEIWQFFRKFRNSKNELTQFTNRRKPAWAHRRQPECLFSFGQYGFSVLKCIYCNADSSNLFVERPSPLLLRDLFFAPEPRELIVGNFVFDPGAPEPWLLLLSLLFVVSKKETTRKNK